MAGFCVFTILLIACGTAATGVNNETAHSSIDKSKLNHTMLSNGLKVYLEEKLEQKLEEETSKWHWHPWHYPRTVLVDDILKEVMCIPSSIDSFPTSLFSEEQLRQGAFLLYGFLGVCIFTLLALVCNDYFIPCVENICEDLHIPQNVAAATFMAAATSTPEFFVNVMSTLFTVSDMGIGTIVGSALFNCLGVASIGALAAIIPIKIERRPVIRDCTIYLFTVFVLLAIVWDGEIYWYESSLLVILYVLYFVLIFNSDRLFNLLDWMMSKFCRRENKVSVLNIGKINYGYDEKIDHYGIRISHVEKGLPEKVAVEKKLSIKEEQPEKPPKSIWRFPKEKSLSYKIWWVWSWPEKLILMCTIPSPKEYRRLYPLSFMVCIAWIGIASYLVSWCVATIGATLFIPDSVMGMTFLAFGACVPEACSIFIMSRKARGDIGVSNAIGANSLAILFSLGMPWFIKCMLELSRGNETKVVIGSEGVGFIVGVIPFAVASLIIVLALTQFTLKKLTGFLLLAMYIIVLLYIILVETGILFIDALPPC